MRHSLKLHPDYVCDAVTSIEVELARPQPRRLELIYSVSGNIKGVSIPPTRVAERTHGLWEQTCLEAFLCSGEKPYFEFNFSPSTAWAAYEFDGYRAGIRNLEIAPPRIETGADVSCLRLRAELELPEHPDAAACRLGLAAVIEEASGRKSYWSLNHPPGKADFHHPDSFVLELPPAP